ncbi:MAG: SIS domain-containing protein [Candidatus Krumholzibacteriia bacterium]
MTADPFRGEIRDELRERVELIKGLGESVYEDLAAIAGSMVDCLRRGGSVFACGNGGSATQAEHFAGELVGRFRMDRGSLPVFCLTDNSAALTSIANDYEFAEVFARQIDGMARSGDCLLALSTSGDSENVTRACRTARGTGLKVFALTGENGGPVASESDRAVRIPDSDTARVQEMHLVLIHLICRMVESAMFSPDGSRTK